ncbi:DUF7529 family protein [Halomicrobium urmianum]|uniref:DUF7529 family protein n=1 Tax=Halomicrobium urmianum TaxID=1586233 RepID=UPI001CDA1240|nr:hypothetical protein [Halomicrobium urmianum]
MSDDSGPFDGDGWERVMEDVHAMAEDYRADGRLVVACHPDAVTAVVGEEDDEQGRAGLDVLVPDDEYEAVRDVLGGRSIDRVDVYRAPDDERIYLLLAAECADGCAVLLPAYYDRDDRDRLERAAAERGLAAYVRRLAADEVVEIDLADPSLLFPD